MMQQLLTVQLPWIPSPPPAEDTELHPSFKNVHLSLTSTTKDSYGHYSCDIAMSTPGC